MKINLSKIDIILCLLIILVIGYTFIYPEFTVDASNAQLFNVYESAELGDSFDDFKAKYSKLDTSYLTITRYQDTVSINTPGLFGARDLLIWMHLTDEKIDCAKIRSTDSLSIKIPNTPPDKGNCEDF